MPRTALAAALAAVSMAGVPLSLGGEVIGNSHTAYQELVAELGLTLIPSYVAEPGELTYVLHEGTFVGDTPSWFSDTDHRSMEHVEHEFAALAATVDPNDPWSHPDAVALDALAVAQWLSTIGATPNVRRALEEAVFDPFRYVFHETRRNSTASVSLSTSAYSHRRPVPIAPTQNHSVRSKRRSHC